MNEDDANDSSNDEVPLTTIADKQKTDISIPVPANDEKCGQLSSSSSNETEMVVMIEETDEKRIQNLQDFTLGTAVPFRVLPYTFLYATFLLSSCALSAIIVGIFSLEIMVAFAIGSALIFTGVMATITVIAAKRESIYRNRNIDLAKVLQKKLLIIFMWYVVNISLCVTQIMIRESDQNHPIFRWIRSSSGSWIETLISTSGIEQFCKISLIVLQMVILMRTATNATLLYYQLYLDCKSCEELDDLYRRLNEMKLMT